MAGSTCDVCGRRDLETFVCCSAIGAVSFAYCEQCHPRIAEPESMFEYLYMISDGNREALREDASEYCTFKDGQYVGFNDWFKQRELQGPPVYPEIPEPIVDPTEDPFGDD